jgi:hypothetical protein
MAANTSNATMNSGVRVEVAESVEALVPHQAAWAALGLEAVEPNVFYEPCFLLPALRAFATPGDLLVVLVFVDPPPAQRNGAPELLGVFPLERRHTAPRLRQVARTLSQSLSHLRLWADEYTYLAVPLLRRGRAAETMTAFLDWLAAQKYAAPILEINPLPLGGQFQAALIEELGRRSGQLYVRERDTRALFDPDCDAATYLGRVLPSKDRREFARQRKRLQELGQVDMVALEPGGDAATWAEQFLALEAGGWKGKNGTAFACKERDARFFREMFAASFAAGRLRSTALRLDGKPLAIQLTFHAGQGAYGFKTAYDEAYSKYGPGTLLEIDLIERTIADPTVRWIDSCAVRDHALFNRIYGERRPFEQCFLTPHPGLATALSLAPAFRWAKASLLAGAQRLRPAPDSEATADGDPAPGSKSPS